jgi:hypothetical protein
MNTKLNQPAALFTAFLFCYFLLVSTGCKKDVKMDAITSDTDVAAATVRTASKPVTFTSNTKQDINLSVFIPCANGGLGETAVMSGPLHILTTFTIGNNSISGKNHFQPQGISGTGDITGAKYQATGITEDEFKGSFLNGQFKTTSVNNFRIIGQGTGNNFLVHSVFHLTVNANGTLTSYVDNFTIECK